MVGKKQWTIANFTKQTQVLKIIPALIVYYIYNELNLFFVVRFRHIPTVIGLFRLIRFLIDIHLFGNTFDGGNTNKQKVIEMAKIHPASVGLKLAIRPEIAVPIIIQTNNSAINMTIINKVYRKPFIAIIRLSFFHIIQPQ